MFGEIKHMRSIFVYISAFLFMLGLGIIVFAQIFERKLDVLTYVCAGYFIATSFAMAVLVSCFEAHSLHSYIPEKAPLTGQPENVEEIPEKV